MQKVELDCNSGVIPGNNVTLIYVGARNGTDTSNVRLRKIITTDDNSDLLSAKLEQTEEEDQEEEDTTSTSSSPGYDKPGADVDVELTKENVTALYNVDVRDVAHHEDSLLHLAGIFDEVVHRLQRIVVLLALLVNLHGLLE